MGFVKIVSYISVFGGLYPSGGYASDGYPAGRPKMNVLFIVVDDLRPQLGCYGVKDIVTPRIDSLARQATVFLNAYCNIPVSGASRASLFTGMYPQYPHRFTAFDARADRDCPEAVPLSGWFGQNGYYTLSNGKVFHQLADHAGSWSETPWRVHPGGYGADWAEYNKWEVWQNSESARYIHPATLRGPFCEWADVPDTAYIDGRVARKTVADLRRLKGKKEPFFLACGFWKPHLPFNAPEKYWDLYPPETIRPASDPYRPEGLPEQVTSSGEIRSYGKFTSVNDESFRREARRGYYACVSYIDAQIGLILDELERLELAGNTVVVLLGDHGWHLGEHGFWGKHNLMNYSTRAPLIVRAPGCKGGKAEGVVEFVDIFPTLCELCGLPAPGNQLQGKSFVPVLNDNRKRIKECAFIQWKGGYNIVTEQYSAAVWLKRDSVVARMMFDRRTDNGENKNIANYGLYRDERRKLERRIRSKKRRLEK